MDGRLGEGVVGWELVVVALVIRLSGGGTLGGGTDQFETSQSNSDREELASVVRGALCPGPPRRGCFPVP